MKRPREFHLCALLTCVAFALADCSAGGGSAPAPVSAPPAATSHGSVRPQVVQQGSGSQVIEYSDPTTGGAPNHLISSGGLLWFTDNTNGIGSLSTAGVFKRYTSAHVTNSNGLALGPDKNIWFSGTQGWIAHTGPAGSVVDIPLPIVANIRGEPCPGSISAAPGDATGVWFTDPCNAAIGRISTDGTVLSEYLSPSNSYTYTLSPGPRQSLWFLENGATFQIASITTNGAVTEYPMPFPVLPATMAYAANKLWISYYGPTNGTPTFHGLISFTSPSSAQEFPSPVADYDYFLSIAQGPDGNVWLADPNPVSGSASSLDSITPGGSYNSEIGVGSILPVESGGQSLVTGPDKNIWFLAGQAGVSPFTLAIYVYVTNPQTVTPTSIAFNMVGETQTFSASEANYTGTLIVTSTNAKVATVAPAATAGEWTVTAVSGGACTIRVRDQDGNETDVSVSVTTETFVVQ